MIVMNASGGATITQQPIQLQQVQQQEGGSSAKKSRGNKSEGVQQTMYQVPVQLISQQQQPQHIVKQEMQSGSKGTACQYNVFYFSANRSRRGNKKDEYTSVDTVVSDVAGGFIGSDQGIT